MSYGTINKVLGVDVDVVSSTPDHELGLVVEADGVRYMYVQADDAVTQYNAVKIDAAAAGSGTAGNVPYLVTPTAAADEVLAGVAQVAFTAGYYGFVAIGGKVIVLVAAGLTALEPLGTTGTAGTLDGVVASAANALAAGSGVGAISVSAIGTPAAGQAYAMLNG